MGNFFMEYNFHLEWLTDLTRYSGLSTWQACLKKRTKGACYFKTDSVASDKIQELKQKLWFGKTYLP